MLNTFGSMPNLIWCTEPSTKTALMPEGCAPPKTLPQWSHRTSLCGSGMSRVGLGQYDVRLTVERAMSGSQPAMGPVSSAQWPPLYSLLGTHFSPASMVLDVPSVTSPILQGTFRYFTLPLPISPIKIG